MPGRSQISAARLYALSNAACASPSLWMPLSPEIRHRVIGRVMRVLSLLYRYDLGGNLKEVVALRVDGEGGGNWYLDVSLERSISDESVVDHAALTIH
jgi:hypothetical protein